MAWRNSSSRGEPPSWRLIEHHSIIYATYKMFGATVPPSLVKMSPELLEEKAGEAEAFLRSLASRHRLMILCSLLGGVMGRHLRHHRLHGNGTFIPIRRLAQGHRAYA